MKLCENIRDLPWVLSRDKITFEAKLFMKSGFFLSLCFGRGYIIERPFSAISNDRLAAMQFEGLFSIGWESKLGNSEYMHFASSILDDKKTAAWLAQYPDEVAKISHDLLYADDAVRFYGAKKLNALPLALNVLNELLLEKVCAIEHQAKIPTIFLKLLSEVAEDNQATEVDRAININNKLKLFFSPENRQEKVAQSILARQFFERADTDLHVPYVLEKLLINYASRNDDAVLMKAIHQNVNGPWDSWVNESGFFKSMFDFERVKTIAYFLHEGCMCESVVRKDMELRGEDLVSVNTWNKINEQRMLLVIPKVELPALRFKI